MNEEEIKQLKLERDTAIFVAKERLDEIEKIKNQKEIFELRYLKADKEIERLNKELEFEKLKNKEVREYVDKWENIARYKLLEMLDKAGDEK